MLATSSIRGCIPDRRQPPPGRHARDAGTGAADRTDAMLGKVLVVDDEADLADMAAALLQARGLQVVVAYSAYDAVALLKDDPAIGAVFSDIMMPGMTGLQLADTVRAMYPHVKVVLASGYTQPALMAESERPYLFAAKPYQIDTILKLLRS